MGKKITRAEESARVAYRRALDKAVRAAAKRSPWKTAGGFIFREDGGCFISAMPVVHIFEHRTAVQLYAKPMALDPVFWDIAGLPANNALPLSFRANGAWTCRPPPFVEVELPEHGMTPDPVARELVAVASTFAERAPQAGAPEPLLDHLRDSARQHPGGWLAETVTTLCLLGRFDEARTLCLDARTNHLSGGFITGDRTFVDQALDWIAARTH